MARALKVGGVTPFSATDYPGKLAAVVFVQGCPWRCGYCHNPHLQARTGDGAIAWSDVMALLRRRVGLVDAVVFSGGEACMDPALASAMQDARALGFDIGLHTACIYPQRLRQVLPLVDWVGFDIKAAFNEYRAITGIANSGDPARACLDAIVASGVAHECRTTIHPALLPDEALLSLAASLAEKGVTHYVLQQFRAEGCANDALVQSTTHGYPAAATLAQIGAMFPRFTFRNEGR
ncbi:anaerobic ribonucleoside-triphosphate reductase activating protein [Janthinobacterium psychrotolerans]|uniref:Anaerobic ribonucleoside-triphosphate reductase activating protein n=1 Tax=Janthinobacterium psychrotolerans TaxID=1747903 RepID=A0A1A7BY96_9BURK|nr:anaerobic ribonucleoside-triphosphate reductase activating protein [Janthinobacterium psychrotolerans]OBV38601.1 anaerobic ribonucleoside-triphosphate reductase activating protein [Janthinobacterium psychrotolerans]